MKTLTLKQIAYARSGDKGCNANIGLIAYTAAGYQRICQDITQERVLRFFESTPVSRVVRYELPNLWALNFVLYDILGKGGSQSLAIDAQGKALGQALLSMAIELPEAEFDLCRSP